jgi:hypothetical protein
MNYNVLRPDMFESEGGHKRECKGERYSHMLHLEEMVEIEVPVPCPSLSQILPPSCNCNLEKDQSTLRLYRPYQWIGLQLLCSELVDIYPDFLWRSKQGTYSLQPGGHPKHKKNFTESMKTLNIKICTITGGKSGCFQEFGFIKRHSHSR